MASLRFSWMKFPLFRRERSNAAMKERQDQAERLVAESFRLLGQVFSKLADAIEAQRLGRSGYPEQEQYLERVDDRKR